MKNINNWKRFNEKQEQDYILNIILDKISKSGYKTLSDKEKELLIKLSNGKEIFDYKDKIIKTPNKISVFANELSNNFLEFNIPKYSNDIFEDELFNLSKELHLFLVFNVSDDIKDDRYLKDFINDMVSIIKWIYKGEKPVKQGEIDINLNGYIRGCIWTFDNRTTFYHQCKDKEWYNELKELVFNLIDKLKERIKDPKFKFL
jgi:hypothetical protein